jgi:hypothetical protein
MRASLTPAEPRKASSTSPITGLMRIAGASRSLATVSRVSIQSAMEAPSPGQAGPSKTDVAPTRSSPLRRPSSWNTSFVATGTRGLTITQGMLGSIKGSSCSPTPVMSQARENRHTGTSAPVASATFWRRASSSDRSLRRASNRSAAAASAEPPPMPAATGSTLSSAKAPSFRFGTASARSLAALNTRLSAILPQAAASGPVVVSFSSPPGSSVSRSAQSAKATTLSRS